MKLPEYESKKILKKHGIHVPKGIVVGEDDDPATAVKENGLEPPLVVKAQVLHGGRGKAGLVKIARSWDELRNHVRELAPLSLKGLVLVEEYVPHSVELYLGFTIDRSAGKPILLASRAGGVDVEEAARAGELVIEHVEPFLGLRGYRARRAGKRLGLQGRLLVGFERTALALYTVMAGLDAELVEVNPLAVAEDGKLVALDAKIIVDDNAVGRHPELGGIERFVELGEFTELEAEARRYGLAFVELGRGAAVVGNGAGLTMATMDLLASLGGSPSCFLDLGGGASAERVKRALQILYRHEGTERILMNIFGGITRGDEVARGIVSALRELGQPKPLIVRLAGNGAREGAEILRGAGVDVYTSLLEAVRAAVA